MNPYLVSWLRFNDENDIAKDECGNTWTVIGTAPKIITIDSICGKAASFSESGEGFLYLAHVPALDTNDFTIDFWEYLDSSYNTILGAIIVFDSVTTGRKRGMEIQYINKNYPQTWWGRNDGSAWVIGNQRVGSKIRNAWVHRAIVKADKTVYAFENGGKVTTFTYPYTTFANTNFSLSVGGHTKVSPNRLFPGRLAEMRVFNGIALWTEPFTPPTTEADYDLTELPFSVFMPANRSIVKPIDESAAIKRTVDKTTDEFANLSSRAVRSENLFQPVTRIVDKTTDESANIKREVRVSTINDIAPIRRTVNVADNFANVKRSTVATKENFSVTNRGVVFSKDYEFQPQRRLLNLADEFAHLRRSVHEPQVVDIYTRRRLVNIADSFSTTQRRVLFSGDNLINSIRRAVCSTENFSPTSRAVIKSAEEFSSTKRRILFSADNDCPNICRLINNSDNFAPVTSRLVFSDIFFANTFRHAMWSEDYYVPLFSHVWKTEEISLPVKATITFETEISAPLSLAVNKSDEVFADTLRRSSLLSLIITLKSPQGETLGRVRFLPYKNSSIGHLCTRFHGSIFYAGLVTLYSPLAGNIHIMKNGITYAVMQS